MANNKVTCFRLISGAVIVCNPEDIVTNTTSEGEKVRISKVIEMFNIPCGDVSKVYDVEFSAISIEVSWIENR